MSGYSVPSFAYNYFPLKLYNLANPREAPRRADSGSINLDSSFYTPFNNIRLYYPPFASYPVNNTPTEDRTNDDFFFIRQPGDAGRLITTNILTQRSIDDVQNFNTPLAFINTPIGSDKGGPVGRVVATTTPDTAPDAPTTYSGYLGSLQYSDTQLANLKSQATFRIPNVGLGLLATTDGAGNVTDVEIDMTYQGLTQRGLDVLNPLYNFVNRQEILLRATLNSPGADIAADNELGLRVGKANDSDNPGTTSLIPVLQNPLNVGLRSQIGNNGLNNNLLGNNLGENPILDRLLSRQPRDQGLLVSGFNTQLDLTGSRNLAANQAGLNVQPGNFFDRNIQQLTQPYVSIATQGDGKTSLAEDLAAITAQQALAANIAKQLDGKIPLAASLPSTENFAKDVLSGSNRMPALMAVDDAMSKKSGAGNPFLYFGALMFAQRESQPLLPQQQQDQNNFGESGSGNSGGFNSNSQQSSSGFSGGGGNFGNQNPFSGGTLAGGSSGFSGFNNGGSSSEFSGGNQQAPQQQFPRRPLTYVA